MQATTTRVRPPAVNPTASDRAASGPGPSTLDGATTLSRVDLDALPWQPVAGCPGVEVKDVRRADDIVLALIRYRPGATTPGHPHPDAGHHIWVVSGWVSIAGQDLIAGSYIHVPPGVAHPITAVSGLGCTLLQVHQRRP